MAFEPRLGGPVPGCPCTWCMLTRSYNSLERFAERLADADTMKDTTAPKSGPDAPYSNVFIREIEAENDKLRASLDEMRQERVERQSVYDELSDLREKNAALKTSMEMMRAEVVFATEKLNDARFLSGAQWAPDTRTVRRCADVLATFYRAPLSMSSVQPLLTLAEELNPSLKGRK